MKSKLLPSIIRHRAVIEAAEKAIEKIQARCPHPADMVEYIPYAHGEFYEKEYTKSFTCLRCDKRWSADSKEEPEEYRRPGKQVKYKWPN